MPSIREINGRQWLWCIVLSVVLLVTAFAVHVARAHDHNNPANNEWLKSLHSKDKTWCCDGSDTDAIEDWDTKNGHYRVKYQGEWFVVPDEALVEGPNKSGVPLLWMQKGWGEKKPRCFMPGTLS